MTLPVGVRDNASTSLNSRGILHLAWRAARCPSSDSSLRPASLAGTIMATTVPPHSGCDGRPLRMQYYGMLNYFFNKNSFVTCDLCSTLNIGQAGKGIPAFTSLKNRKAIFVSVLYFCGHKTGSSTLRISKATGPWFALAGPFKFL